MTTTLRVGTRGSSLATTQTGHVVAALVGIGGFDTELVRIRTEGDRLTGSLATLGGTGVFAVALRGALLVGRCDLAVHSLKDLPTAPATGLTIGAIPEREDPRDALCARDGLTLTDLPPGSTVGTGSPRRAAQLLAARPDLVVVDIRGNVDTRLGRVAPHGDLDAVLLARSGLARLGRLDAVTDTLDPAVMTPAPGQGALAVECRAPGVGAEVPGLAAALAALDHRPSRLAVTAERALLARLEAGCAAPVGALGSLTGEVLHLDAVVSRTDGTQSLRLAAELTLPGDADLSTETDAAVELGVRLAEMLLDAGAGDLAALGPKPVAPAEADA